MWYTDIGNVKFVAYKSLPYGVKRLRTERAGTIFRPGGIAKGRRSDWEVKNGMESGLRRLL